MRCSTSAHRAALTTGEAFVPQKPAPEHQEREELPLSKAAEYLLDECRMVLPGIQALFGFQLIAVFHPAFAEKLSGAEQQLHLMAITLLVVAVAIIMSPAALHRGMNPREVNATFIRVSTRLLLWSMVPLALSICAEFYLVGRIILGSSVVALLATALFALFIALWFVVPRVQILQRIIGGTEQATRSWEDGL
jgi:hypothetical protein